MKKANTQIILSAAILSLIITAGTISFARAQSTSENEISMERNGRHLMERGGFATHFTNRKQMNQAFNEVREAIENNDYQAWASLMSERNHDESFINEETFAQLQEMHELFKNGDTEGAKAIEEDLGIRKFGTKKMAMRQFSAVKQAIDAKDYQAWAELMNQNPRNEHMDTSEEAFNTHVRIHELMEQGNTQEAQELMNELGIARRGNGKGNGMGRFHR